ncbi:MAG: DUF2267 domain-containing protein [Chloroflexi bacterium]|nr:DUF2267 domain-containing protein [Chloroflexota bacterium]
MDDLIKLVTEKAGISTEQAKIAIETVVGFLKDKLPAPIAGQLDKVISGAGGGMDSLKGVAGGLFGKK